MTYNYPQSQYQVPIGYNGYRPAPQYPQWTQTANTNPQVRPVSSIEEVKASPIDFDGSIFYFTDIANKKIYTKQINMDGTVSINLYEQKDLLSSLSDQILDISQFVTRQEFETIISDLKQLLINPETIQDTTAQKTSTFNF